ncbi:hypothetical protein GCM10010435_70590 [Winogradskya consettensis]|uniref:Uncharacterized protein n=1 Tax=Winogradskya consettensis TaxID=113560 RepID=A0A919SN48_9ACTN|nr:hypothetical protein Aco04nite_45520 [Actinoplanes consettensis]
MSPVLRDGRLTGGIGSFAVNGSGSFAAEVSMSVFALLLVLSQPAADISATVPPAWSTRRRVSPRRSVMATTIAGGFGNPRHPSAVDPLYY